MPPPSSSSGSPESAGVVWLVIGLFGLITGIWLLAHAQLVAAFFVLKKAEIVAIDFFLGKYSGLGVVSDFISSVSPSAVSYDQLISVGQRVGFWLRFPVIGALLSMAVVQFSRNVKTNYSQQYTLESLCRAESVNWPFDRIVLDQDLVSQDIDQGPWAMALSPMDFAKKNYLLQEYLSAPTGERVRQEEQIFVVVLKTRASRIFTLQLGKLWEGIDRLNAHTKALCAVFISKLNRDSDAARALLFQLSASAAEGSLNTQGVDALLEKHRNAAPVKAVLDKHAYTLTMMASLLQMARTDGVLSSAEFLWLKPVDRRLWFMLNAVGRRTAPAEVAGPFAHWLVEKKLGRPVRTPMVDQAVKALEVAIREIRYTPESRIK